MDKASKQNIRKKLSPEDFINHPDVLACIGNLTQEFGEGKRPFIVSDIIDEDGHQYAHLVQKGGGVLGIALVGYTYILEKMGIRFLRLAGTSAGAINTALMTVIGEKKDEKSTHILEALSNLDFFCLVDGRPSVRRIIKSFISHHNFTTRVKWFSSIIVIIGILLFLVNFVLLGLHHWYPALSDYAFISFIVSAFYFLLMGAIYYYLYLNLKRLKKRGYGINPGDYFYDWIKLQLQSNGVHTVSDLNKKASTLPDLKLRADNPQDASTLFGDVTFITSELVTQNKIQFPEMCYLFREKDNIDSLQPAGFIRASMSIPLFFESYYIDKIPCDKQEIKDAWLNTFNEPDPPSIARFVDGGILSNFPINIFYNSKITVPRLPSFGIDLDDSKPDDQKLTATGWSITGYLGRIFNTIRFYYDKDFLLKNRMYEKGIGKIPLSEYNWLNFFLSDQDKIDMFIKGAQAATKFLITDYNWDDYKLRRTVMQIKLDINEGKISLTKP